MGGVSRSITSAQRAALRTIAPALAPGVYLAGGVAVALACGHRTSHDLDLFVPEDFDADRVAERLMALQRTMRITGTAPGTLYLEIGEIPASLLSYRYPLLAKLQRYPDVAVRVASPADLVCMKLSAIASRGAARDFWDLHVMLSKGAAGGTLSAALDRYRKKFPGDDIGHVVRSLAYFGDADAAPLPRGLSSKAWRRIEADFEHWVSELA
jgi:hypothetical protein